MRSVYVGNGGNSSSVASKLSGGVVSISSSAYAFAAIKGDGSVVTWGDASTRCFVLLLVFLCCDLWLLLFSGVRAWCCDGLVGICVAVGVALLCAAVCTGVRRVPHMWRVV